MPAKIARSTPRPSFGLPELPVAIHISRLASKDAAKSLLSTLVSESSGECRIKSITPVYLRDLGIEVPSGHLVTGHIIATDPRGQSLLPKSASVTVNAAHLAEGEVVIYRVFAAPPNSRMARGGSLNLRLAMWLRQARTR
jgi:hypothetical protein